MKAVASDFTDGVNAVAERRKLPSGFVLVADNVDLRGGYAKPFKLPAFSKAATSGTTCIWEYNGKWYESSRYRKYSGELQGTQERVYYCEIGAGHSIPQKIVNSVQDTLGQPVPITQPVASQSAAVVPIGLSISFLASGGSLPPGSYGYRVAAIISGQTCVPSQEIICNIPEVEPIGGNYYSVTLTWTAVEDATGYIVFGRNPSGEQVMITVGTQTAWTDDGSITPSGNFASVYDVKFPYTYLYTYVRKVGPMEDESGPSPVSSSIVAGNSRIVQRFPLTDGFLDGASSLTAVSYAASSNSATPTGIAQTGTGVTITFGAPLDLDIWETGQKMRFYDGTTITPTDYDLGITIPTALSNVSSVTATAVSATSGLAAGIYKWAVVAIKGLTAMNVPATTASVETGLKSINANENVTVSWSGVYNADGYRVYRWSQTSNSWAIVDTLGPNTTQVVDTGQNETWTGTTPSATNTTATNVVVINNGTVSDSVITSLPTAYLARTVCTSTVDTGIVNDDDGKPVFCSGATQTNMNGSHLAFVLTSKTFWVPVFAAAAGSFTSVKVPTGKNNYTAWRLYRSGDSGSEFLRVAEVSLGDDSYLDFKGVKGLGEALPTYYLDAGNVPVTFAAPPPDLLCPESYNGMLFGIHGNDLRWTPIGKPDAWPDTYSLSFDYPPLALKAFNGSLIVFCADGVWRVDGFDSQSLRASKTKGDGCVAPYSVQEVGSYLVYLAKRGLMLFTGNDAICVSESVIPYKMLIYPGSYPDGFSRQGFYWQTTDNTDAYGQLMWTNGGMSPAIDSFSGVNQANTPLEDVVYDIRSFSWQNKYFLYYTTANGNNYSAGTTWCFDLIAAARITPVVTLGLVPIDAHVTSTGEAYVLLPDDSGGSNNSAMFAGYQSRFNSGPYAYASSPGAGIYKFNPVQGANAPIRMRSGEEALGSVTSRKRWREILVAGEGTGQLRVYLDGSLLTFPNGNTYANIDCNSTPAHLHRVLLPIGSWGYSISWEIIGDLIIRAVEYGVDRMPGEE